MDAAELLLQSFTAGLAALATWFIYEHIRDFKNFKKEASRDISSLQKERTHFEAMVRSASHDIAHRVLDLQRLHNDFSLEMKNSISTVGFELEKIKSIVREMKDKTEQHEAYLKKTFELSRYFSEKIKTHEEEIKTMRLDLGDLMIFKKKDN